MKNASSFFKKIIVSSLALAMIIGGPTSALADGKKNDKHEKFERYDRDSWNDRDDEDDDDRNQYDYNNVKFDLKGKGKGKLKIKLEFKDVDDGMEWARKHIASLASKKIFDGYEDGTFKPHKPVTRVEAVATAVRLMGLKDEAESDEQKNKPLTFRDGNQIEKKHAWAVGYLNLAVENDLIADENGFFNPEKPADRLWVAILLVKALGLEDEAIARANEQLTFRDADEIPLQLRGYVALAVEKKIVQGYNDNKFKPNKPVTRAELAAFLDRTGEYIPDFKNGEIRGTINTEVSSNSLSILKGNQSVQLSLDPNAFIYRDGSKITASQLKIGDEVLIRTYNGIVIFIEVVKTADVVNTNLTGTVNAKVTSDNKLSIKKADQTTVNYALATNAEIYRDGVKVSASALEIGDEVFVRIENNQVVFVQVTKKAVVTANFNGTVNAVVSANKLSIKKQDNTNVEYSLAANADIFRNGVEVTSAALQVGDEVFVQIVNNEVVLVQVTKTAVVNENVSGTITAAVSANKITIKKADQTTVEYNLASNVEVYRGGNKVAASALMVGDEVFVVVNNNQVVFLQVTKTVEVNLNVTGTINTAVTANKLSIKKADNTNVEYSIAANAEIYRNGIKVNSATLKAGDEVFVVVQNSEIIFVQVTKAIEDQSFTVDGLFHSMTLNTEGKIATITITRALTGGGTQETIYVVSSDVTITGNLALLVANQPVELKGHNQTVTSITIK